MKQAIPWLTSAGTLLAIYLTGKKRWQGWAVGLANQAVWITFIVLFDAWGLMPLALALIVLYIKNLIAWRREEPALGLNVSVGNYTITGTPRPGDTVLVDETYVFRWSGSGWARAGGYDTSKGTVSG